MYARTFGLGRLARNPKSRVPEDGHPCPSEGGGSEILRNARTLAHAHQAWALSAHGVRGGVLGVASDNAARKAGR